MEQMKIFEMERISQAVKDNTIPLVRRHRRPSGTRSSLEIRESLFQRLTREERKRPLENESDINNENFKRLRYRIQGLGKLLEEKQSIGDKLDEKLVQSVDTCVAMLEEIVHKKKPATCKIKTLEGFQVDQIQDGVNNTCQKLRKSFDDTLRELIVHQYSTIMKSVGCLMSHNGKGTIFRVGSKYGMTAAHVVNAIINPYNQEEGDASRLNNNHVYVSFSEAGLDQSQKFKLAGRVEFFDAVLDVAIVEFSEEGIPYLPPALSLLTFDVCSSSSDVAVIGYGHGNNEFKCLEHSVEVINPESVPVSDIRRYLEQHGHTFKPVLKSLGKDPSCVDTGYTGYNAKHHVLLNAYVGCGASGSPILTKADPSALKVAGIYTSGYPKLSYELPPTLRYPNQWTFEAGTKMNFIYDSLKSKNEKLAEDIFSG